MGLRQIAKGSRPITKVRVSLRAFARRGRRSERRPAAPSFASYLPADALKRAAAARQKNDYRNAIAERRQAVSLRPDVREAHGMLGDLLLAQGFAAEAIPHLETAGNVYS